jgi:hypothetical protein
MASENNGFALRQLRPLALIVFGVILLVASSAIGLAQDRQDKKREGGGFPDLVAGLKATPGCLGVETARTGSGKSVIFAWFEDKKAALRWYYSGMHQGAMKSFFPDHKEGTPLKDVPEDSGPIMAIASITMTDKPQYKESKLPISQIAIELYQPVSGGIFLGGRFAPDSLKVQGMRNVAKQQ